MPAHRSSSRGSQEEGSYSVGTHQNEKLSSSFWQFLAIQDGDSLSVWMAAWLSVCRASSLHEFRTKQRFLLHQPPCSHQTSQSEVDCVPHAQQPHCPSPGQETQGRKGFFRLSWRLTLLSPGPLAQLSGDTWCLVLQLQGHQRVRALIKIASSRALSQSSSSNGSPSYPKEACFSFSISTTQARLSLCPCLLNRKEEPTTTTEQSESARSQEE